MLPAFLVRHAGLNSGFMILQVTAAALASELKPLAAPHSVDSIPTSANQEDYVSMGMGGAGGWNRCSRICEIFSRSNLLAACQGIDLLSPLRTGPETRKAYDIVRALSNAVDADRSLAPDIEGCDLRARRWEQQDRFACLIDECSRQESFRARCGTTCLLFFQRPSAGICRSGALRCS